MNSRKQIMWAGFISFVCSQIMCTQEPQIIHLFNGNNLDGFYVLTKEHPRSPIARGINNDPNKVFTIQDGMIRVSGQDWGHFITYGEYENYKLRVEWKWGEETWPPREDRARDSGILVHCIPPERVWNTSIEYQIIEGGTGDFICVRGARLTVGDTTKTRGRFNRLHRDPWKDVKGYRHPENEYEKPHGEWNISEIICDGSSITNIINGTIVNEGQNAYPHKGQILFQSEGAEIFFRRIDLYPL